MGTRRTAGVGARHCERFLTHLFRNNTFVSAVFTGLAIPLVDQHARAANVAGWACARAS